MAIPKFFSLPRRTAAPAPPRQQAWQGAMTKSSPDARFFYVYGLFDADGIIRYIGKGRGNRWLAHDKARDPNNRLKNFFITRTIRALGEVPKIKIRENLTEAEAFEIEAALIKAIGRYPNGPLTNLTDKRNGPSSETITKWHASRSPEDRRATARKIGETVRKTMTPEERSERARRNGSSGGREALAARMATVRAMQSPEKRSEIARKGGLASAASRTDEHREAAMSGLRRYQETLTREQRQEIFQNSPLARATKSQLSEWGKKGVAKLNASNTPEQRSANSRKGVLAARAMKTPEENLAISRKGLQAARLAAAKQTPDKRKETGLKVATIRRLRGTNASKEKGGRWINNGVIRKRLKKDAIDPGRMGLWISQEDKLSKAASIKVQ